LPKPAEQSTTEKVYSTNQKAGETSADYHDEISDDNRCWGKIFSQTRETDDFRFKMESRLSSFVDDWFYRKEAPLPKTPIHSAPNLFMLGLARAGLLGDLHRDYVKSDALALEYLEEAATLDPTNSAPMIYAAIVAAEPAVAKLKERLKQRYKQN
jgi:hypothetical protein